VRHGCDSGEHLGLAWSGIGHTAIQQLVGVAERAVGSCSIAAWSRPSVSMAMRSRYRRVPGDSGFFSRCLLGTVPVARVRSSVTLTDVHAADDCELDIRIGGGLTADLLSADPLPPTPWRWGEPGTRIERRPLAAQSAHCLGQFRQGLPIDVRG
jgi:hypothetical protein